MMGTKEDDSIDRKPFIFESPIFQLRLTVKGENYVGELSSDLTDINSPLNELARRHFYFFFRTMRLACSSTPVFSLISPSPSISRQISDSELFEFGSSLDLDPFSAGEISDSMVPKLGSGSHCVKLYSGGKLYRFTKGTFEDDHACQPHDNLYKFCTEMSHIVYGENIFLIGGIEGFNRAMGRPEFSTRALRFNKTEFNDIGADLDSYRISEMNSGKGTKSIALEHKGILYVLANSFIEVLQYTFESYDIKTDEWKTLNPPPIHMWGVPKLLREIFSYAVMDDKIYVSTKLDAYVYHISRNEWNACFLFDVDIELFDLEEESKVLPSTYNPYLTTLESEYFETELRGGPPFEFDGEGIYFDNKILICVSISRGLILAYLVDSEKVQDMQILCYLPELPALRTNTDYKVKLVGLGNGFFSATYNKDFESRSLVLVVFHISWRVEPSDGKPLNCRICCRHEIGLASVYDWDNGFCFAM